MAIALAGLVILMLALTVLDLLIPVPPSSCWARVPTSLRAIVGALSVRRR